MVEDLIDLGELPPDLQTLRFGRSADASVQLLEVSAGAASYRLADRQVSACVPGGGEHRAMSLAAVLGVFTALGIDPGPALTLDDALVPQGRGNRLQVSGVTIIDDSYNANPASMAAALVALGQVDGRKVAVLGEMLELGEAADEHHRGLAALCSDIDRVFTVGAGIEVLDETLGASLGGHFQEPGQVLLEILLAELQPGDTVLVKGSNRVFWSRGFVNQLTDHLADA